MRTPSSSNPKYFSVLPTGPKPKESFTEGFYQAALEQNPKPTTIALAAEDAEFSNNACEGAREHAKKFNLKIVYDRKYPPSTTDFTPIVRALQAANPDLVIICSYPLSSVGIVNTINELNYKPKMIGGAMVGLQATVFKQRLGAKLNGIVNYETWVPSEKLMAPARAFFDKYQARAAPKASIRSATISAAGAMPISALWDRPSTAPRASRTTRSLTTTSQERVQDHHGQLELRPRRRMDQVRHDAGAVSRHQRGRDLKGMNYQTCSRPRKTRPAR